MAGRNALWESELSFQRGGYVLGASEVGRARFDFFLFFFLPSLVLCMVMGFLFKQFL